MRIISLVPSFTELLFDLDLDSHVVGITRFCIRPKNKIKRVAKIGGTKSLKIERIISLQPDLIFANKEENSQADIIELSKHLNVWITNIFTLKDALNMILDLGLKTNTALRAQNLTSKILEEFGSLRDQISLETKKRVAYVIWQNPIMLAGQNTFINNMLHELNWENVISSLGSRYPEISDIELQNLNPEIILLSSEPFPFKASHKKQFEKIFPNSQVILVDGEIFSWYGSRLKYAPEYFKQLLNEVEKN